ELEDLALWAEAFAAFCARFDDLFARSESRCQAHKYLRGLVAPLERMTSWQLVGHLRWTGPCGMGPAEALLGKECAARRRCMRQQDPLRPLSDEEHGVLEPLSRSSREPAVVVARAKAVRAVAAGASYSEAARAAGRHSGDAIGRLVARFNREGLAALVP